MAKLGMTDCLVEYQKCAYIVIFPDGSSILLQTDYDQAAFAVSCGLIKAPADWDGCPSKLDGWGDYDLEDISECPDEYLTVAEKEEEPCTA